MNQEHGKLTKRNIGLVLAWALLMAGGVALCFGVSDSSIRVLGAVLCIVSAYLVRVSKRHTLPDTNGGTKLFKTDDGSFRLIVRISAVLLPVAGLSFYFLYRDALLGYHQEWPVYLFAVVVLVCASVWSALVAKLIAGK